MPCVMNSTSMRSGPITPSAPYRASDQRAGRLHDALQGAAQVEVAADADHRVEQGAQPLPAGSPPRRPGRAAPAAARRGAPGTAGSARDRGSPRDARRRGGRAQRTRRHAIGARARSRRRRARAPRRCRPPGRPASAACAAGRHGPGRRGPAAAPGTAGPSPASSRRSAARVSGTSTAALSGSSETPRSVATSQAADSASPARSQLPGSSSGPKSSPYAGRPVVAGADRQGARLAEVAVRHRGARRAGRQHGGGSGRCLAGCARSSTPAPRRPPDPRRSPRRPARPPPPAR